MTSVREINILLTMDHPNIVNVSEVVTGFKKDGSQDVYMVMEFVQQDLKSFLGKYQARLKIGEVCPVNITRAWHRQVDCSLIIYSLMKWLSLRQAQPVVGLCLPGVGSICSF